MNSGFRGPNILYLGFFTLFPCLLVIISYFLSLYLVVFCLFVSWFCIVVYSGFLFYLSYIFYLIL